MTYWSVISVSVPDFPLEFAGFLIISPSGKILRIEGKIQYLLEMSGEKYRFFTVVNSFEAAF